MNEEKKHVMTEEEILAAPEADYMNEAQLAFFENRLFELYELTLAHIERAKEEMIAPMEFSDESDRASSEEQSAIALRIIDREQKLLPK
ncbi:RNA polymerase-binding protein DksA, partial [Escherichia coli]|nr:RNA polymerase-binding protein DksA [Escherichia coli]